MTAPNTPATAAENAAYRDGRCVDCRIVRYSAGRPRCNECHANMFAPIPPPPPPRPSWLHLFDGADITESS